MDGKRRGGRTAVTRGIPGRAAVLHRSITAQKF
jgi:hypothetical protein